MSTIDTPSTSGKTGAVLVVGGGIGGMQAALDLGNAGFKVYLAEEKPAIGGRMAQLDKTFPTNDCSMCTISPRLVEVDKHPNIQILTNTEVLDVGGDAGRFTVKLLRHPRYVDTEKCNACGDCFEVCPVEVPNEFEAGIGPRKAIYKLYPQAIPNKAAVQKAGTSPCQAACPSHVHVQGYLALTRKGKYREALSLIRRDCPLPSVCGRVCVRFCESKCSRGSIDEAVAINDIKWFLSEQDSGVDLPEREPDRGRSVAVVGAGPGGLSCAYYLALRGYSVTVFEKEDEPGGVLRYGIPEYRLPKAILARDIDYIRQCGVEIVCSTALGRDFTLEDLRNRGYEAVFLAVGCSTGAKLGIPGEDAAGVIQGIDFLKASAQSRSIDVGSSAAVIGGGNVAIDAARTLVRLGVGQVTIVYRRSREEMPAYDEEIDAALEEGVGIKYLAAPAEIIANNGRVTGLKCVAMELGPPDASGRRRPIPVAGSDFVIDVDMVAPAVGQTVAPEFLDSLVGVRTAKGNTIGVDPLTCQTSIDWIFAAGDVATGPRTVIEAIAGGKEAAESIRRALEGEDLRAGRDSSFSVANPSTNGIGPSPRLHKAALPPNERKRSFDETHLGFDETTAQAEADRCLNCGICSECLECVRVCRAGAVKHDDRPEEFSLNVGAVILVPGFDTFQAEIKGEYGYDRMANVVTSMEFERLLSASGPTGGEVRRPSDGKHPEKIAWIQCVGSRDVTCGREYCSSVCCMYATKEAIIAKEHDGRIRPTIFFNDIRAFGKGFELYYETAQTTHGVRYVRGIPSAIKEEQRTKNLFLSFRGEDGRVTKETFDMAVLSVGLQPSASTKKLAERCRIKLNRFGFGDTAELTPNRTSRPGVFVAGAFEAPMDIPESVMGAASAAALSAELLGEVRNTLIESRAFVEERDVREEEPRIGVFVCHCGSNIARIVDVPEVVQYAAQLPHAVHAENNLFTCSTDTTVAIAATVREKGINRLVVASCSPRTHEPLFRDVCREAGLNRYLFEMANIRDQCSWVHQVEPAAATEKSKDLVRMAVARAALLEPIHEHKFQVVPRGVVIGGGVAGMTAALSLAEQGFDTALVERDAQLGGVALRMRRTVTGMNVPAFVTRLEEQVRSNPRITVLTESEPIDLSGHVGRYTVGVRAIGSGEVNHLEAGAIVVATGGVEYEPTEYLRGASPLVWTQTELDRRIHDDPAGLSDVKSVVMIQCVGSREPDNLYCSRVCCGTAVKNALALKAFNPTASIYVLYRDMRTYGFKELAYRRAREAGVTFLRYERERKPVVEKSSAGLRVAVFDRIIQRDVEITADLVVLSAAIRPHPETEALGALLKLPRNDVGFFMEAHMKLRPLDFASEGIYLCGLAHGPKYLGEAIAQARGAAARAATVLSKDLLQVSGEVSVVDPDLCASCLTCVRACPYHVPAIDPSTNRAFIEAASCQGCGICASVCPRKAIRLQHHTDAQVLAKVSTL